MIIDEILDAKYKNYKINKKYIRGEARLFGFTDIVEAIDQKSPTDLKKALENYVIKNGYNLKVIDEIQKLRIKF